MFDDPGKSRQAITADQTLGYLPYSVKLQKTDLFPNELYGTKVTSATGVAAPVPLPAEAAAPAPVVVAVQTPVADPEPVRMGGLTAKQLGIAAMIMGLMQFSGRQSGLSEWRPQECGRRQAEACATSGFG